MIEILKGLEWPLSWRWESLSLELPKIFDFKKPQNIVKSNSITFYNSFGQDFKEETLYQNFLKNIKSDSTLQSDNSFYQSTEFPKEASFLLDHPIVTISRISKTYSEMSREKDINSKQLQQLRIVKSSFMKSLEEIENQLLSLTCKKKSLLAKLQDCTLNEKYYQENSNLKTLKIS